jgi:hypothetical protein
MIMGEDHDPIRDKIWDEHAAGLDGDPEQELDDDDQALQS